MHVFFPLMEISIARLLYLFKLVYLMSQHEARVY